MYDSYVEAWNQPWCWVLGLSSKPSNSHPLTNCAIGRTVWVPRIALRCDNLLEGLRELREDAILTYGVL